MKSFTIQEIAELVKGELVGNTNQKIDGPEELQKATSSQISFIGSRKYTHLWKTSKACVAIVNENLKIEPEENRALIKVKNADLAMAKILELFNPSSPEFEVEIHATAVIHESAKIGKDSKIGANCYIGKDVVLGEGVVLYPNVCIFDETKIGDFSVVWSD